MLDKYKPVDFPAQDEANLIEKLFQKERGQFRGESEANSLDFEVFAPFADVIAEVIHDLVLVVVEKEDTALAVGLQLLQLEVLVDQIHEVVRVYSVHFLYCICELYLVIVGDVLVIEANRSVLVDGDDEIILVSVGLVEEKAVVI